MTKEKSFDRFNKAFQEIATQVDEGFYGSPVIDLEALRMDVHEICADYEIDLGLDEDDGGYPNEDEFYRRRWS